MLAAALVAEADAFVASFNEERLADGRQRIVRHGLPNIIQGIKFNDGIEINNVDETSAA